MLNCFICRARNRQVNESALAEHFEERSVKSHEPGFALSKQQFAYSSPPRDHIAGQTLWEGDGRGWRLARTAKRRVPWAAGAQRGRQEHIDSQHRGARDS